MFQVFLERGCDLQVSDSFGRTPLHNVAWAGEFSERMVKLILDHDLLQLMVQDKQGKCALEYVRKEHYQHWITFLKETLDVYWPLDKNLSQLMTAMLPLERGPLPDPISPLSVDLASQVAAGKISVDEVAKMDYAMRRSYKLPPQLVSLFG
jgi:ankyrin repeat protein